MNKYQKLHKERIKQYEQYRLCHRQARSRRARNRLAGTAQGTFGTQKRPLLRYRLRHMVRIAACYGSRRPVVRQACGSRAVGDDAPVESTLQNFYSMMRRRKEAHEFAQSLLQNKDVMAYVFRKSKKVRQYIDFETVRGHPIPVRVVAMEGWRRYYSQPNIQQKYAGMDIYRGRWSDDRIAAYLKDGPCISSGFSAGAD